MMVDDAKAGPNDMNEIDGEAFNDIVVAGRVIDQTMEAMKYMIYIDDSTAVRAISFFTKGSSEVPSALGNFRFDGSGNQYVRIQGFVKNFQDQKLIIGIALQPIEKHDNFVNHLLQVFLSSQQRHKGILSKDEIQQASAGRTKQENSTDQSQHVQVVLEIAKQLHKER